MNGHKLICTDLDRTLLPNGNHQESENARMLFTRISDMPDVDVAYVSGRHKSLVLDAIKEYGIPEPDYVIADVGSTIYRVMNSEWNVLDDWEKKISEDWNGYSRESIASLFSGDEELTLQEPEKQNTYKLSFYVPVENDATSLVSRIKSQLDKKGIGASIIWSIDEMSSVGLLDILPNQASKLQAIEFIMQNKNYHHENVVFSGDSGNDLSVLTSHIQSVLVANAHEDVRSQAIRIAKESGTTDALYIAKGGFMGMNGNYSAGILEGVAHYIPEIAERLSL